MSPSAPQVAMCCVGVCDCAWRQHLLTGRRSFAFAARNCSQVNPWLEVVPCYPRRVCLFGACASPGSRRRSVRGNPYSYNAMRAAPLWKNMHVKVIAAIRAQADQSPGWQAKSKSITSGTSSCTLVCAVTTSCSRQTSFASGRWQWPLWTVSSLRPPHVYWVSCLRAWGALCCPAACPWALHHICNL
jgi:hypothetical protein